MRASVYDVTEFLQSLRLTFVEHSLIYEIFTNEYKVQTHFRSLFHTLIMFLIRLNSIIIGAGVAQLVNARSSELEVPGSILRDFNICFDFFLISVVLALNTRKTEH